MDTFYRLHKDAEVIVISDSEDDGDMSRLDVVEDSDFDDIITNEDDIITNEDDSNVSTKDLEEQDISYE